MKLLIELFLTFAKVGVMTFGGGYAMLPIIQREIAENKKWATEEELSDYYAVSQCTPGVIAVNTATFIGQKYMGVIGGIVATLGVVFPSLVIIVVLAGLITNFAELPAVQWAFGGVRVCVCVLIFNSICKLWKSSVKGWLGISIFAVVTVLTLVLDVSPVVFVLIAAVLGIIVEQIRNAAAKKRGEKG